MDSTLDPADVTFESGVFLLLKTKARELKAAPEYIPGEGMEATPKPEPVSISALGPEPSPEPEPGATQKTIQIRGDVPPEIWNRLGTKILPKLRIGSDLKIGVELCVTVGGNLESSLKEELKKILEDLGLVGRVQTY